MRGALIVGQNDPGGLQIGTEGGATVRFLPTEASWPGISFGNYAVSSAINNTELEKCGRPGGSCVQFAGSFSGGPAPAPVLKNVTIRDALEIGIAMSYGGRPGPGSTNITIIGTTGTGFLSGMPFFVHRTPVSAIPPGNYRGNHRDFIGIYELEIRDDETLLRHDIPYFVYGGIWVGDSVTNPTLTLPPGVSMSFAAGVRLWIGWTAPGAIRAVGTAEEPITLTAEGDTPGSWIGVQIGYYADSSSLFDHVIVENAGALDPWVAGAFHFYVDVGEIIRNTIVRRSAGCGIIIVNQPAWSTDFTDPALGNTFADNAGGAQCGP